MRRFHRKLIAGMALTMFVTLGLAASAGAASSAPAATDVPVLNLTAAQQQALQVEVDKHLKNYGGGKQISINQVSYENGAMILTLALPGETKARAVDEPIAPQGVANCAFQNACLWSGTNFNGDRIQRLPCGLITLDAPFNSSTGSIHNNQTTDTQTIVLNSSSQILNANQAPSRINDTGVGTRANVRLWRVC